MGGEVGEEDKYPVEGEVGEEEQEPPTQEGKEQGPPTQAPMLVGL